MHKFTGLIFMWISFFAQANDPYVKNDAINVTHYTFELEVNDSTDVLGGKATVDIAFTRAVSFFELDLVSRSGKDGMEVVQVLQNDHAIRFSHHNDRLKIFLIEPSKKNEHHSFRILYHGIPRDGLVIGKNKFGDRGFFGDNWPDRGHHWLPVIDHPSDKASVDFIVMAPLHYAVIANGIKVEESLIDAKRKLTHYREEMDLPVKVMVVGIARFAVEYVGTVDDISVQSWVYPQNRLAGFHDYAVAIRIMDYFHHHIGPYPFKKLANVQSKTRWGGLENAGAIFYAESTVTGGGDQESLIAHEEAHQWFGDAATENDWHHVWLSEGFATYFSHLYLEFAYGHDRLVEEEKKDRIAAIDYFNKRPSPVVDTTVRDINAVLNTNTYQKGGWVLHMLRHKIGDVAFWKGIQQYYATYKGKNAVTGDFQQVMEGASGTNLSDFFQQWLFRAGHPRLLVRWNYDGTAKRVSLSVDQLQAGPAFNTPLEVGFRSASGEWQIETLSLSAKTQQFMIPADHLPTEIVLDPYTWLLFEAEIKVR